MAPSSSHVHPSARLTRVVTAAAAETIRTRDGSTRDGSTRDGSMRDGSTSDGSTHARRPGPPVLSAGTRALFIELRTGGYWGDLAEIEPLDGPHEGERLLLLAEHLDLYGL